MSLPDIIVIAHGKTERMLFEWLQSELKTRIVIDAPNGNDTVSMMGVRDVLMREEYSDYRRLMRRFPGLDSGDRARTIERLRIFPILDVDGDGRTFGPYRSGDLLRDVPLGRHVVPIYNNPRLEAVLEAAGYGHVKHDTGAFSEFLDTLDVDEFLERIRLCEGTNMEVAIEHIMGECPSYQGRLRGR